MPVEFVFATSRIVAVGLPEMGVYFEFNVAAQPDSSSIAERQIALECMVSPDMTDPLSVRPIIPLVRLARNSLPRRRVTHELNRPAKQGRLE